MKQQRYVPLAHKNESPFSLVLRFAWNNGFKNIALYHRVLSIRYIQFRTELIKGSKSHNSLLAQKLYTAKELKDLSECFFKLSYHNQSRRVRILETDLPLDILRRNIALCPSCAKNGHLERMHCFIWSTTCPIHNQRYIEKCPNCHQALHWTKLDTDFFCPCGFDLKLSPSEFDDGCHSRTISNHLDSSNNDYFKNLLACLHATHCFDAFDTKIRDIEDCIEIANGLKQTFFTVVARNQAEFPCLHRRAILAPWMITHSKLLRNFAFEYYHNTSQRKPESLVKNCNCSKLSFTADEFTYLFNSSRPPEILRKIGKISQATNHHVRRRLSQCKDLCLELINLPHIEWEKHTQTAKPVDTFKLLNLAQAAAYLNISTNAISALCKVKIIKSVRLNRASPFLITESSLNDFNRDFILCPEIYNRLKLPRSITRTILLRLGLAPIAFKSLRLTVYTRTIELEDLLNLLGKNIAPLPILPPNGATSFSAAARRLRLAGPDTEYLLNSKLFPSSQTYDDKNSLNNSRCPNTLLTEAIKWRDDHLTIAEAARFIGCSSAMLVQRFIVPGFIPSVKLAQTTLINKHSATLAQNNFSKYTTINAAHKEFGCSIALIKLLIRRGELRLLPHSNLNHIENIELFSKDRLSKLLEQRG
ncbi:TniQ family protein [Metapseudomonas resinovorans]|uniref:TniQ family protein n=1 Tax=Metapseudomonas resinovorans TaxID=53412 RepID=UPI000D1C2A9D|nr:TniQ family protein [Pseudomonas resinovorans]